MDKMNKYRLHKFHPDKCITTHIILTVQFILKSKYSLNTHLCHAIFEIKSSNECMGKSKLQA